MKTFKQHIKEGGMTQSKYGAGQIGSTTSVSPEDTSITTLELGWVDNTTVNVTVVPVSETVTAVFDLEKPAVSLSAVAALNV